MLIESGGFEYKRKLNEGKIFRNDEGIWSVRLFLVCKTCVYLTFELLRSVEYLKRLLHFSLSFQKIGMSNKEIVLQNNQMNCTCPEDCSSNNWKYKDNVTAIGSLVFNCSTFPGYKKSVKKCLEDFDVNNHPNRWLLPKNSCGRQRSGEKNSVSNQL